MNKSNCVDPNYYKGLFARLLEGKLSAKETEELVNWLGREELDPLASDLMLTQFSHTGAHEQLTPELRQMLESKLPSILAQPTAVVRRLSPFTRWFRIAAAVIILLGASVFAWVAMQSSRSTGETTAMAKPGATDFKPGKEGAILTLADGRIVVLDSLGNGVIAEQNGTQVLLKNGELAYNAETAGSVAAYNTMTTPKGRQFRLVLQDGTKVWLNAASSLRYPTVFAGQSRNVEITGEAYFEVAKNAAMPFRVKIDGHTEIEVLGTHFNVNSYRDEASVNMTLLEGSVRISHGNQKTIIRPGQQARVSQQAEDQIKVVNDVNMEKVMAWKNGLFNFQDATLHEVMRQLERWYDIEVIYEKGVPEQEFMGKMGRDLSLSEVLRGLEVSEVHFRIQDGKLIVTP